MDVVFLRLYLDFNIFHQFLQVNYINNLINVQHSAPLSLCPVDPETGIMFPVLEEAAILDNCD